MDVVVEILGRATVKDEFSVIISHTVTINDGKTLVTPQIPAEAKDLDLRLRLETPPDGTVEFYISHNHYKKSWGGGQMTQLRPFKAGASILIAPAGVWLP